MLSSTPKYMMWYLYIIKQREKLYTGITTDLKNRLHQHGNPPLLYKETFENKHQAARRERQIKGFSRAKKQNLIKGFIKWACPVDLHWSSDFTMLTAFLPSVRIFSIHSGPKGPTWFCTMRIAAYGRNAEFFHFKILFLWVYTELWISPWVKSKRSETCSKIRVGWALAHTVNLSAGLEQ